MVSLKLHIFSRQLKSLFTWENTAHVVISFITFITFVIFFLIASRLKAEDTNYFQISSESVVYNEDSTSFFSNPITIAKYP